MKKFMTFIRRFFILNKRLLKKPAFLSILLLIPILVCALAIASDGGENGVLTVSLAAFDYSDPLASEIIDDLQNERGLVRFIKTENPAQAQALVESGKADAAWIFPDQMKKKIDEFVSFPNPRNAFVAVIQREDNILLKISHEKLNAVLYPYLSLALTENYVYVNIISQQELDESTLKEFYDAVSAEGDDLFKLTYSSDQGSVNGESANYLLSPVRGLMAVAILLCGFAAAMFYMRDEEMGTFDRMPIKRRFFFSLGYHSVAVTDIALIALVTLLITGLSVGFLRELFAMIVYILITVGFCIGLRLLCRDIRILGALAPVITVVSTVLCPIFFISPDLPIIQYLLPTYYYVNAIYKPEFLGFALIYAVIIYGADYLIYRMRTR